MELVSNFYTSELCINWCFFLKSSIAFAVNTTINFFYPFFSLGFFLGGGREEGVFFLLLLLLLLFIEVPKTVGWCGQILFLVPFVLSYAVNKLVYLTV